MIAEAIREIQPQAEVPFHHTDKLAVAQEVDMSQELVDLQHLEEEGAFTKVELLLH